MLVVLAVFTIGLWASGVAVEAWWLRFYSAAVLAVGVLWTTWDRWLWRTAGPQRSPSVPPVIHGTWKGTVTSLWRDPATDARPQPKAAYLVVRQTATNVSAVMFTDEARSRSTLAHVDSAAGMETLSYTYLSRPAVSVEDRSRMHHGTAMLDIVGRPGRRLDGRYWTDRDSRGELRFTRRVGDLAGDFEEAEALFEGTGEDASG
ncbi:MAG: hypothetical protein JJT89_04875 [Nitriliruptoraceae bacterium]|nr:hypothetical protein [Nitriliruptoraceae bacterium]